MIRAATLSDLPRLFELVLMMHAGSKYADEVGVDNTAARSILRDGVLRNGGAYNGATLLNVIDVGGTIEGFMLGILQRVYSIGNRLEAQDFWLFCTKAAPATAPSRLIDAYIKWADENPKVAEITLSWTAVSQASEKMARLYQRKGFARCGEIFKRAA